MKPETILHALTDLDEDLILDAAEQPCRPNIHRRRLSALLTAAVLASTLVGTCFAYTDGASWFRRFFTAHSGEVLTESKNAYLDQSAAAFRQSYTKDGFTVSLESALSDGVNTIIQFRVEAPEGTALDAHSYGITNWEGFELVGGNGETLRDSGGWDSYDENPNDNIFSLLYTSCNNWYDKHIDRIFGTTWSVRIDSIQGRYLENLHTENFRYWDETLVTGPWEFNITLPESGNRELQFISQPVTLPVTMQHPIRTEDREEKGYIIPEYYQEDIVITSLRLRALSFAIDFQRIDGTKANADFESFAIVTRDGSEVIVGTHQSGLLGTVGSGAPGRITFNLGSPIVLEEVDHILLPNGTKLYPQK